MIVIFTLMNTQRVIIAWMPKHIRFAKDMLREGEREKGKQEVRKGGREKGREGEEERGERERKRKSCFYIEKIFIWKIEW